MRYKTAIISILITAFLLTGCGRQTAAMPAQYLSGQTAKVSQSENFQNALTIPEIFIHVSGDTLETRFFVPKGYVRTSAEEGSFTEFLRNYSLKEDKSPILFYNGEAKQGHSHQAVFALPIEATDLQQCADSVMRVYAEYLYWSGQQEKIAFHFTNGFLAKYSRWRDGGRIVVRGKNVSWTQSAAYDDSYKCFQRYLQMVFTYAGTISMESESRKISLAELRVGDVFLKGGSPGHVVMVVDICENEEGKKAFLLGQGHMPAQEFHVLKNPLHRNNPWYYEEEISYPFVTPDYVFPEGSLRRLCYLE